MGEVYYVYQNTQIFIRREKRARVIIFLSFLLFLSLYVAYAVLYILFEEN